MLEYSNVCPGHTILHKVIERFIGCPSCCPTTNSVRLSVIYTASVPSPYTFTALYYKNSCYHAFNLVILLLQLLGALSPTPTGSPLLDPTEGHLSPRSPDFASPQFLHSFHSICENYNKNMILRGRLLKCAKPVVRNPSHIGCLTVSRSPSANTALATRAYHPAHKTNVLPTPKRSLLEQLKFEYNPRSNWPADYHLEIN